MPYHTTWLDEPLILQDRRFRDDGKVITPGRRERSEKRSGGLRAELDRREVRPDVLAFCRGELVQQNYFHTILEAAKSVADKLRNLTATTGDGSQLTDTPVLPAASLRLRFNSLATEWERSEQTGIATLMKGQFSTFRNPAAHAPEVAWATARSDALDMLTPRVHAAPPARRGRRQVAAPMIFLRTASI